MKQICYNNAVPICASGGMVDTLALGASAFGRESSSLFSRTIENRDRQGLYFLWYRKTRTFTPGRKVINQIIISCTFLNLS